MYVATAGDRSELAADSVLWDTEHGRQIQGKPPNTFIKQLLKDSGYKDITELRTAMKSQKSLRNCSWLAEQARSSKYIFIKLLFIMYTIFCYTVYYQIPLYDVYNVYNVECTMYTVHGFYFSLCTMRIVQCTMFIVHCTMNIAHFIMYSVN